MTNQDTALADPLSTDAPSDAELLQACRQGDDAAWAQVLDRYERLIYSIPLRIGLSRDDAAEVFQLTFSALLNSIDAVRDPAKLGGWLATVARRHTWRILRRSQTEVPFPNDSDEGELSEDAALLGRTATDPLEAREVTVWLNQGLIRLGQRCRDLLTVLYFEPEPLPYATVATKIGIPLGSIGPTRARCIEQLRKLLQEN